MASAWFICPYDVFKSPVTKTAGRRCAMHRYLHVLPDGEGSDWDEAETLDGHALVWVDTTAAKMALISADPDFLEVPTPDVTVAKDRGLITDKMIALGYTQGEIDATGWVSNALFDLLTVAMNRYRVRAGTDDQVEPNPEKPGRQPPRKLASQIKGYEK